MGEKAADDAARELLFSTASERGAHAVAVKALLARNASLRTNDELIEEELRADPAFGGEWTRTALGRAMATALVRYRAEHDLSQCALADKLRMTRLEIARLEVGDFNSPEDMLIRITVLTSTFHLRAASACESSCEVTSRNSATTSAGSRSAATRVASIARAGPASGRWQRSGSGSGT